MFTNTQLASQSFPKEFNEDYYLERTKRNHYWLGGVDGQMRLQDLKVGVAGLGGMGSNIAEILVRLGVGHIKIADPDIIEVSNLNRQVIANSKTIGVSKAKASAMELRNLSKDFELIVYEDGITEENAQEFVSELDVLIDEIDVFPLMAHRWLHEAANELNLPIYSGFIIGLGTHVYKFQGKDYTLMDFLKHDKAQIEKPTVDFLLDRFVNPRPDCLKSDLAMNQFAATVETGNVPIFGTSTFMSHSLLAIRAIVDALSLNETLGGQKTPTMPEFIALDPLDLTLKICNIEELSTP